MGSAALLWSGRHRLRGADRAWRLGASEEVVVVVGPGAACAAYYLRRPSQMGCTSRALAGRRAMRPRVGSGRLLWSRPTAGPRRSRRNYVARGPFAGTRPPQSRWPDRWSVTSLESGKGCWSAGRSVALPELGRRQCRVRVLGIGVPWPSSGLVGSVLSRAPGSPAPLDVLVAPLSIGRIFLLCGRWQRAGGRSSV